MCTTAIREISSVFRVSVVIWLVSLAADEARVSDTQYNLNMRAFHVRCEGNRRRVDQSYSSVAGVV